MKRILITCFIFLSMAACTNPEDSVNNNTDSAHNSNAEKSTLNTQPGAFTPDTSGGAGADTSMDATTGGSSRKTSGAEGGSKPEQ